MIPNPQVAPDRLYTRRFFQAFGAVGLFMMGAALQFHFGEFVEYLGYGVSTLGRLLSIAMLGRLLIRVHVGRWIDRFGFRPVWLAGTLCFAVATAAIQFTTHLWLVAALEALSAMAVAATMTAVPVFAAQIAPPHRRAESIGTLGLAGFLGLVIGPTLGDLIFSGTAHSMGPYRVFFSLSAIFSVLAGVAMLSVPSPVNRIAEQSSPTITSVGAGPRQSQIRVILRHWPGAVLIVGVTFNIDYCLQSLFLERLAEERGFYNIKAFFLVYGPTAMTLRIVFRRLPERLGRVRTLLGGLVFLATGLLCLIGIRTQSQLILPAVLMGAGHCFIFPSMVDLAAERLPPEHRGTGTALILGAGDLGLLIGYATVGELIDAFGFDVALVTLAAVTLLGAGTFAVAHRRGRFGPSERPPQVDYSFGPEAATAETRGAIPPRLATGVRCAATSEAPPK
jgi:MFS family permease